MEQLRCGKTGDKNVQLVWQKLYFAFYQPPSNLLQVAKSCCRKYRVVLLFATKFVHVHVLPVQGKLVLQQVT